MTHTAQVHQTPCNNPRLLHCSVPPVGLFNLKDFSTPDSFVTATQTALYESKTIVNEIISCRPDITVIQKMDKLSNTLCNVADLGECIRQLHPDPEMIQNAQEACMAIGNYVEELNTNPQLYNSLKALVNSKQYESFDEVTKCTAETFLHDFEINGIHLESSKRDKVVELSSSILDTSYQFHYNTSLPTQVPKKSCPSPLIKCFQESNGYIHVDHIPYYDTNADVRALSYLLFYGRNTGQETLLGNLLNARQQLATLVGYPTFAHRVLKSSMARDPATVQAFLDALNKKILPLAKREVNEMVRLKQEMKPLQGDSDTIRPWDISIVTAERQKQSKLLNIHSVQNYFSLSDCISGLDTIFKALFGIRLQLVPIKDGEVWDTKVLKLAFVHDTEGVIGYTYADLLARSGKLASDCHFTIRGGCELQMDDVVTSYQLPVITLCCSIESDPLSQHAVENLFHEMGHALHSMLGRSKYQNVTGTRCSTDFAEVPSILMEFFLADSRVLSKFAKHYKTREPISSDSIKSFQFSNHFFPAYETQTQIFHAAMDLSLHSEPLKAGETVLDRYAFLHSKYSPIEHIPNTATVSRFNHFYSYAAKYYSYLWSRAVASLIWKSCFANDPFSAESGAKYRDLLRHGGGIHPTTLVKNLLGYDPSISDLVNALYDNVIKKQSLVNTF